MKTLRNWIGSAIALGVGLTTASCDLSVTNAGPVQDEFLDETGAHAAVVAGMELRLARALNMVNFWGSETAKEYTQGGRIEPTKLPPEPRQLDNEQIPGTAWSQAHQFRWVAEDGVRRLQETGGAPELVAAAQLYAGYANRMLGENMCEAVIDGGAIEPRTVHLARAEQYFTDALATAVPGSTVAVAAQAGRASVRLWLGDDAGADQDAAAVPLDFVFQAQFAGDATANYNRTYWISSNTPYRAHSVVKTYYEQHYTDTGDPRTPWVTDPAVPTAEFSHVPWLRQTKYTGNASPINLSSGREMVLIRAEVALRNGDWPGALTLINSLRQGLVSDHTGNALPPWTAADATEAWTALKRERGIELWLEARRLGDLWRWADGGVPGEMEDVTNLIRLCYPIATGELQTNPNIDLTHESPTNPLFTGLRSDWP